MLSHKFLMLTSNCCRYLRNIRFSSTFTLFKDNDAVKKYNDKQKLTKIENERKSIFNFIKPKKIEMHESHSTEPFIVKTPSYIIKENNNNI